MAALTKMFTVFVAASLFLMKVSAENVAPVPAENYLFEEYTNKDLQNRDQPFISVDPHNGRDLADYSYDLESEYSYDLESEYSYSFTAEATEASTEATIITLTPTVEEMENLDEVTSSSESSSGSDSIWIIVGPVLAVVIVVAGLAVWYHKKKPAPTPTGTSEPLNPQGGNAV